MPVEQSRRMVDALRAHGKEVQWMNFPREGHGLSLVANQRRFYRALIDFLDQNTAPLPTASAASAAK